MSKHGHARPAAIRPGRYGKRDIPFRTTVASGQRKQSGRSLPDLGPRDLLVVAVSGGASALLSAPAAPITLADKQATTDLLLRAGADIFELNCVRKHISTLKGGGLAAMAYPATVVCLLLSDVVGDPLDVIGSGLTVPDPRRSRTHSMS